MIFGSKVHALLWINFALCTVACWHNEHNKTYVNWHLAQSRTKNSLTDVGIAYLNSRTAVIRSQTDLLLVFHHLLCCLWALCCYTVTTLLRLTWLSWGPFLLQLSASCRVTWPMFDAQSDTIVFSCSSHFLMGLYEVQVAPCIICAVVSYAVWKRWSDTVHCEACQCGGWLNELLKICI